MFRYFHLHNLPEIFTDYFVTNKDIHNYNTRNAALLHKKFNRTNYNKHTLANKRTDVWNNLPSQYKEIRSFPIFKATMKKHFLHQSLTNSKEEFNCFITAVAIEVFLKCCINSFAHKNKLI